jgi:hypothetical protein
MHRPTPRRKSARRAIGRCIPKTADPCPTNPVRGRMGQRRIHPQAPLPDRKACRIAADVVGADAGRRIWPRRAQIIQRCRSMRPAQTPRMAACLAMQPHRRRRPLRKANRSGRHCGCAIGADVIGARGQRRGSAPPIPWTPRARRTRPARKPPLQAQSLCRLRVLLPARTLTVARSAGVAGARAFRLRRNRRATPLKTRPKKVMHG